MLTRERVRNEVLKAFIAGVSQGVTLMLDRENPVDVKTPAYKYANKVLEEIFPVGQAAGSRETANE